MAAGNRRLPGPERSADRGASRPRRHPPAFRLLGRGVFLPWAMPAAEAGSSSGLLSCFPLAPTSASHPICRRCLPPLLKPPSLHRLARGPDAPISRVVARGLRRETPGHLTPSRRNPGAVPLGGGLP
jgi:hypothetical protein